MAYGIKAVFRAPLEAMQIIQNHERVLVESKIANLSVTPWKLPVEVNDKEERIVKVPYRVNKTFLGLYLVSGLALLAAIGFVVLRSPGGQKLGIAKTALILAASTLAAYILLGIALTLSKKKTIAAQQQNRAPQPRGRDPVEAGGMEKSPQVALRELGEKRRRLLESQDGSSAAEREEKIDQIHASIIALLGEVAMKGRRSEAEMIQLIKARIIALEALHLVITNAPLPELEKAQKLQECVDKILIAVDALRIFIPKAPLPKCLMDKKFGYSADEDGSMILKPVEASSKPQEPYYYS